MDKYQYARALESVRRIVWIQGEPWELGSGLLRPIGRPDDPLHNTPEDILRAVKRSHSYGALWSEGWNTEPTGWWYVVADDPAYDLGQFDKKVRYYVKRGLNSCRIERLDISWLAENGYALRVADAGKTGRPPEPEDRYRQSLRERCSLQDYQAWGAFVDERLVACATVIIIDDTVQVLTAFSDPAFYKEYPNNGLYYLMTRDYLVERRFRYISFGSRVLHHETNVQHFLTKLGYRRVYSRFQLVLRPELNLAMKLGIGAVARWGRRVGVLKSIGGRIEALEKAWLIARGHTMVETEANETEAHGD